MMATVPHVTSGLGLRKFQADGFLLTRVYEQHVDDEYGALVESYWQGYEQSLDRSSELQESEASTFQDNRHMKAVRLSVLRTGHLYPQEIFLILIYVSD